MDTEILDNIQLYGFKWYRRVTMLGVAASTAVIVGGVWMMADGVSEYDLMAFLWGGMLAFLGTWLAGECTFILDRLYRGWKIYGFLHGEYAGHKNDAGWLQDTLGKVQEKIERGGMGVELYGKYHTLLCKRLRILKKRPCQLSVIPYQKNPGTPDKERNLPFPVVGIYIGRDNPCGGQEYGAFYFSMRYSVGDSDGAGIHDSRKDKGLSVQDFLSGNLQ